MDAPDFKLISYYDKYCLQLQGIKTRNKSSLKVVPIWGRTMPLLFNNHAIHPHPPNDQIFIHVSPQINYLYNGEPVV